MQQTSTIRFSFIATLICCITLGTFYIYKNQSPSSILLKTEYGEFTVTEPVLIDLLNDPYVQRLKNVRQYGAPYYYMIKKDEYNRFDHSVGVFVLLRKFGAPLKEQIAGLLHDVSQTVFSHVGDWVFKTAGKTYQAGDAYQDTIHEAFINKTTIAAVLKKHGFTVSEILHKNKEFTLAEQDLPDVCADRLEYNLKGGLLEGLLTNNDVTTILQNVTIQNGKWVFTNCESAKKFARISLFQTQYVWSSPESHMVSQWAANILLQAVKINLLTFDDIHFSTDDVVWEKLLKSDDPIIQEHFKKGFHYKDYMVCVETNDYDVISPVKFRGINPLVKTDQGITRLTEADQEFAQEFKTVHERVKGGWKIKFLSPEKEATA